MKVVHVARTPLAGTVARTALQWGTGGLNIDLSRVGADGRPLRVIDPDPSTNGAVFAGRAKPGSGFDGGSRAVGTTNLGRWPANLILSHKPGCRQAGTQTVRAKQLTAGRRTIRWGVGEGGDTYERGTGAEFATEDGLDEAPLWVCEPGCPVQEVDEQSAGSTTGVRSERSREARVEGTNWFYDNHRSTEYPGEDGGPARYFKQVQEQPPMSMPQDLIDYLTKMIGTPIMQGLYMRGIDDERLKSWDDNTIPGLVVEGQPTPDQAKELMRVLMPGAHLLLVAPDEEPTGHTGACTIEDAGFEIRDAILWAREGGKLHYVPKAGRAERETGCGHLKGKAGHEAVERQADTAGVNNPRAGAGRTASHVRNFHPTVKPIALMKRLLADVPTEGAVLDPFMGSGSTGIAAVQTGHSFVGVEMGEEYLEIAHARIEHWGSQQLRNAEFKSDYQRPPEEKPEAQGLELFFGFGEEG